MTEKSSSSPAAGGSRRIQAVPVDGAGYRFELMETFVRIVEAGSLSAAAVQLHTTQPTISRR
ncbi:helix-turn-helix domain-containing protein, partial [Burkholderia cenocepacia]|uniref:helix-turn-helix domain-containing protein n=2 Tax=Burkholderia TaxID=32008 RepID=UPI0012AEC84A